MYRETPAARPPRIVHYGWFPPRPGRVAFGLLCLALAAGLSIGATALTELRCTRGPDGVGACTLRRTGPFGNKSRFSSDAISETRAGVRTGKGDRVTAHLVTLLDRHGRETSLAWSEREDAAAALELASRFFAPGSTVPELWLHERASGWGVLLCILFAVGGGVVAIDAFRGSGGFRIAVDLDRGRVVSTPRLRWPKRSRTLDFERIREVRLTRGTLHDRWKTRGQTDERAARLTLVCGDGTHWSPTDRFLRCSSARQEALHERGRVELSRALELDVREEPREPHPGVRSVRERWGALSNTTRGTIVFFGTVSALAVVGQIAVELHATHTGGFIDVKCARRCRFAGAECLPGGSYSMGLDPGVHTIEIYDPDAPGKWRPREVRVELGATTSVVCE